MNMQAWDMRSGLDWMDVPPGHFRVRSTPPLFFYQGLFVGGREIPLYVLDQPGAAPHRVIGWAQPGTPTGTLWAIA